MLWRDAFDVGDAVTGYSDHRSLKAGVQRNGVSLEDDVEGHYVNRPLEARSLVGWCLFLGNAVLGDYDNRRLDTGLGDTAIGQRDNKLFGAKLWRDGFSLEDATAGHDHRSPKGVKRNGASLEDYVKRPLEAMLWRDGLKMLL